MTGSFPQQSIAPMGTFYEGSRNRDHAQYARRHGRASRLNAAARQPCWAWLQQRGSVGISPTATGLAVDTLLKKLYRALKAV